ncbi:MAG: hypothetical protein JSW28_09640 [Thermoplasmata archaeon]|nr:MAG: hypothetical protein JSW28_09640 [Thermoplasmata archaeon]
MKKVPDENAPTTFSHKVSEVYTIKKVVFRCKAEENEELRLFKTVIPTAYIFRKSQSGIPSVLGTELLTQNRLKLVFSPTEDVAYFEKIE